MEFRTKVEIPRASFELVPCEEMLLVGSCFAQNIGSRFRENMFRATVNPFGVMYNPASIFHSVERWEGQAHVAVLTLGTNHVYRLRETGEIVDNCRKRPQHLFREEELSVEVCASFLSQTVDLLKHRNPAIRIILTVSPIRYRKYGYPGSQLSKSTLLLAAAQTTARYEDVSYFPAYEIMNDELRDYRFYAPDMIHPSEQAVDYIWERVGETYFGEAVRAFLRQWEPIREALAHRPFHPESPEYQSFMAQTRERFARLKAQYPEMPMDHVK